MLLHWTTFWAPLHSNHHVAFIQKMLCRSAAHWWFYIYRACAETWIGKFITTGKMQARQRHTKMELYFEKYWERSTNNAIRPIKVRAVSGVDCRRRSLSMPGSSRKGRNLRDFCLEGEERHRSRCGRNVSKYHKGSFLLRHHVDHRNVSGQLSLSRPF